jgi:hypothetical protein
MIANTKQVRKVIRQAVKNLGVVYTPSSWTNGYKNKDGTRNVGFCFSGSDVDRVAIKARHIARELGYTNEFRVTDASKKKLRFYGGHYVRVTTVLA